MKFLFFFFLQQTAVSDNIYFLKVLDLLISFSSIEVLQDKREI